MAVTTILVDKKPEMIQKWTDYLKEYDRETCKTAALDLAGLGTPKVAGNETLEEVLDLMGKVAGGVALILAHANPNGLIMRTTTNALSAQTKVLRGISRAWKAIDQIIPLRSGKWPASGKPEFLVDVPAAVAVFKTLIGELRKLSGDFANQLADPTTVTNRAEADAWFDKWFDLMAKACLGGDCGETDFRRVCRAMQKVRNARFERVELRACNIGQDKENLNALKEFFGAGMVVAPKVTMFFGTAAVLLNTQEALDQLARHLGGFRGNQLTPPGQPRHRLNHITGGEAAMAIGRRNRVFPVHGPVDAIMQETEIGVTKDTPHTFVFHGRLFGASAATVTRFLQANYKTGYVYQPRTEFSRVALDGTLYQVLPVGGMWNPDDSKAQAPFVLPLEATYRDLLETST